MKHFLLSALLLPATIASAQTTNPAPYCTGAFVSNQAHINSVSLGTLSNMTGNSVSSTGYDYYNNLTAPTLTKGNNYTVSVDFSFTTPHYVGVFIDYNQNGSFADAGELVLNKAIDNNGWPTSPASQSFTIPAAATTGQTRMRVIIFEDDDYTWNPPVQPAEPYSCVPTPGPTSYQTGQTQDYNVNISGGTAQQAPTATASAASSITGSTATLNGTVNANGASTSVVFEYGTTAAYGQTAAATPATVTGNTATAVTTALSGLMPNTTYYYRVKATNGGGVTNSSAMTFTTNAPLPVPLATVSAAASVTTNTAQLNGTVNANGTSATVVFEYGTTTAYGQTATATPATVTGSTATAVTAALSGLTPNTTYYYRLKATNGGGIANSTGMSFTTNAAVPQMPGVATAMATTVSDTAARISGAVMANGGAATIVFEYGTSTAYGQTVAATPATATGFSPVMASAMLTNLLPNTTYHYRVKATNSVGTAAGSDMSFKTSPLGLTAAESEKTFVVAPNPSTGVIRLIGKSSLPGQPVTATFYNLMGQQVLQTTPDATGTIQAEQLPAGHYQLRLSTGNGSAEFHPVMIQK